MAPGSSAKPPDPPFCKLSKPQSIRGAQRRDCLVHLFSSCELLGGGRCHWSFSILIYRSKRPVSEKTFCSISRTPEISALPDWRRKGKKGGLPCKLLKRKRKAARNSLSTLKARFTSGVNPL